MFKNVCFYVIFLCHFMIKLDVSQDLISSQKNINCNKTCSQCYKELIYCPQFDECGCCQSCLRLIGEFCDAVNLCDHTRQLFCQIDESSNNGICKYMENLIKGSYEENNEKICIFNGMVYQSSVRFSVSCRHRCQCTDGLVSCQDLCQAIEQSVPPPISICPHGAELIPSSDNQCCREWSCKNDYLGVLSDQLVTFLRKRKIYNNINNNSNKLCNNKLQADTPWSKCSKKCGMGISTRTSTNNILCVNVTQKRFCMYRECPNKVEAIPKNLKIQQCTPTNRPANSSKIQIVLPNEGNENFSEIVCLSKRKFRPRFCGACFHCCEPVSSKTKRIEFECSDKINRIQMYEWIKICACSKKMCS